MIDLLQILLLLQPNDDVTIILMLLTAAYTAAHTTKSTTQVRLGYCYHHANIYCNLLPNTYYYHYKDTNATTATTPFVALFVWWCLCSFCCSTATAAFVNARTWLPNGTNWSLYIWLVCKSNACPAAVAVEEHKSDTKQSHTNSCKQ